MTENLFTRVGLADGRQVQLRPVRASDAPATQAFVRGLSPQTCRNRFHLPLKELPPPLLRQLTEVDLDAHVAIVAEAASDDGAPARIVAEARYVKDGDETHFAIVVADAWQRAGLGRALTRRLLQHAARRGIARLVADMLVGNVAVARLLQSFGARRVALPRQPGVVRAQLDLAPPPRRTCR